MTNVNGTLYFVASDSSGGRELWKSDGTQAGTVRVKDIASGADNSFPSSLTNVNGTLYFTASD
ncbi:ELWxxDGT repeat protein, partial [Nostoc sp. CALU 546]|uniref:ELWxxDGT repeat protein n=1 Tax=Nostoc sp. CALU 546 TaxID=1867241 RepID=UPI003B685C74